MAEPQNAEADELLLINALRQRDAALAERDALAQRVAELEAVREAAYALSLYDRFGDDDDRETTRLFAALNTALDAAEPEHG